MLAKIAPTMTTARSKQLRLPWVIFSVSSADLPGLAAGSLFE